MLKVLTILPGLSMGGAEHMAYELIKNLDADVFESCVLCYKGKLNTSLEKQMEKVCPVTYGNVNNSISLFDFVKVFRLIKAFNPDIIHAHMGGVTFSVPWTWIKNKPLIITIHTKPERAFSKKNNWLIRHVLPRGKTRLVAVSYENQKKVQDYYSVDDSICHYINNGIDINKYTRKEHDTFTFINVARQDENKNQKVILDCFQKIHAQNPRTQLFLIGDGPLHDELCEQVKHYDLQDAVCIPGLVDDPEKYYSLSDAYVLSSHREAMPLSVLEAMAANLPIISTDVGGLRDVIQDNGIIVEDNDQESFYRAMNHLANCSKEELMRMGNVSKKIVESYSSQEMARRYSNLYLSITNLKG